MIRDGYHVFADARGPTLLGGRTVEDLQVQPASAFMHPDRRREAIGRMHAMVEERTVLDYVEEKIVRLDGGVLDIEVTSRLLRVGVSIGVASARIGDQVTADSLLADADVAMYQAKSTGSSGAARFTQARVPLREPGALA